MLQVMICESKYPRKGSEYSVWLVEAKDAVPELMSFMDVHLSDALRLRLCVKVAGSGRELADLTAKVWRDYLPKLNSDELEALSD